MNNVIDIRSHLKGALIDLDAARENRRAGYTARIPRADMRLLEKQLTQTSSRFDALMQELVTHP
jgi:hypothetical protein